MTRPLPRSLDDVRGLRAARWTRESTVGQADNFGPDAQRDQQDRAIRAWGLVDTGIAYDVAHSGRTIASSSQWAEMVAAAGDAFDVLVVGYVSRFARDLRTAVNARHDLHIAGAVILFADEEVLSSDEEKWEPWAREAVEAEAYSRRLGKRIREGYAAKRRRLGVPGGNRPPLGTVRTGREIAIDAPSLEVVRQAYELAGVGRTDRDVAAALGLMLKHVAEILTNPFYVGRLRDGSPSVLGELVDVVLWERVQSLRSRYSRRHRGSSRRQRYALSGILACAACGRRLIGHSGRIRHVECCEPFRAAAPRRSRAHSWARDKRVRGESYRAELYDRAVAGAFAHVAASASLMVETVELATVPDPVRADVFAAARIGREREAAALRFTRDRDVSALEATMARLDAELEQAAERDVATPTAAQAREYLESLPKLWDETTVDGRRAMAEAVFERIDVLGVTEYSIVPTADAIAQGWDLAFGRAAITCTIGHSGRGGRSSAAGSELVATIRLAVPPSTRPRIARSA